MTAKNNAISQTARRQTGNRDLARLPVVQVVGSGASLDSLESPRFVSFAEILEIGRRPPTVNGRTALALADRTVSSLHARISRSPQAVDEFIVEDLGSTNGTDLDGRRIERPTPLREGALLFLGSHVLVFRTVTPTELVAMQEQAANPMGPSATLSPALALTATKLRLLARSATELLLVGETGVGKEVFANAIHTASGRAGKLVAINCAALPGELVESELFGYEKGAHSTAQGRKAGLVETAKGGTLFLDEIGEMPVELQSKLLRFLQDRRFTPLGSTRIVEADVRIIAATSRTALAKGTYVQEALLGRLGAQPIELPPLRERFEDIGRLAARFLKDAGREAPDAPAFEPEAFQALLLHDWPLNVRELVKVIGEAAVLSRGAAIGLEHLPDAITARLQGEAEEPADDTDVDPVPRPVVGGDTSKLPELAGQTGRASGTRVRRPAPTANELTDLLARYQGSVANVARHLNRQYAVVWRCIQRYGIDADSFRGTGGSTT
jgi:transcriptional regulator with GAF, ATPase, and Fis domain